MEPTASIRLTCGVLWTEAVDYASPRPHTGRRRSSSCFSVTVYCTEYGVRVVVSSLYTRGKLGRCGGCSLDSDWAGDGSSAGSRPGAGMERTWRQGVGSDMGFYCFLETNKGQLLHPAAAASISGGRGLSAGAAIASARAGLARADSQTIYGLGLGEQDGQDGAG